MNALYRIKTHGICLLAVCALCLVPGYSAAADVQVKKISGAVKKSVSLEKIPDMKMADQIQTINKNADLAPINREDKIISAEFLGVQGNEMMLRVSYHIDAKHRGPIYAGSFLYNEDHQAIDVGYKPVMVNNLPDGTVDIALVLQAEPFKSAYVKSFLMDSANPNLAKGYFRLNYNWKGMPSVKKMTDMGIAKVDLSTNKAKSKEDFCKSYAERAVTQLKFGSAHNLPGLVPPVWNPDKKAHYDWCLTVDREQAIQGDTLRQSHIDRYVPSSGSGNNSATNVKMHTNPATKRGAMPIPPPEPKVGGNKTIKDAVEIIKPGAGKALDPGRGGNTVNQGSAGTMNSVADEETLGQ